MGRTVRLKALLLAAHTPGGETGSPSKKHEENAITFFELAQGKPQPLSGFFLKKNPPCTSSATLR
jgi:hypothetical protein